MGSGAFCLAADAPTGSIIEVGSERTDGSTTWLKTLAQWRDVPFYTIDMNAEAYRRAYEVTRGHGLAVHGRAEIVLADWSDRPPSFVFLDGHDWPYTWCEGADWATRLESEVYAPLGLAVTREASQQSHRDVSEVINRAGWSTVAVFDDTWPTPSGGWDGKGGTAVPYLLERGWRIDRKSVV